MTRASDATLERLTPKNLVAGSDLTLRDFALQPSTGTSAVRLSGLASSFFEEESAVARRVSLLYVAQGPS